MEPQTNSGQALSGKYIVIGVVLLILSSAIGAIIGPVLSSGGNTGTQNQSASAPIFQAPTANAADFVQDLRILSGSVTAISGSNFTLHTQISGITNASLIDRTVIVTGETKIIKTAQKDQATLSSEMAAFAKNMQDAKTKPQLVLQPEPFTRTPADALEISIGDIVTVITAENISTKKEFVASEIEFHAPIAMPLKK